jgi:UDPglucose 6-dehydrogenase
MRVGVIGLGYLGVTHAVAMASLGHKVVGIEASAERLGKLKEGELPFFEPGLAAGLADAIAAGNLSFAAAASAADDCDLYFLCVGTPQLSGSNAADTSFVFAAGEALAKVISEETVVVGKSTVPVGTAASLREKMSEIAGFDVKLAWNPEFLREGTALEDSLKPDRIVIGSWHKESVAALRNCYEKIIAAGTAVIETDVATSELVKVAANAFLATKISFINAMAEVAEVAGADAVSLAEAIGYDERIGKKFLRTGVGFGGGCLPKDIRGFVARAEELGVGHAVSFLRDVDAINLRRRQRVLSLLKSSLAIWRAAECWFWGLPSNQTRMICETPPHLTWLWV